MEDKIIEIDNIKADLNYEQLLGRAVDRALFQRTVCRQSFREAVIALEIAMVDLPGKPLRSDIDEYIKKTPGYTLSGLLSNEGIQVYQSVFKKITSILAKYKMLFKSVPIEINR